MNNKQERERDKGGGGEGKRERNKETETHLSNRGVKVIKAKTIKKQLNISFVLV